MDHAPTAGMRGVGATRSTARTRLDGARERVRSTAPLLLAVVRESRRRLAVLGVVTATGWAILAGCAAAWLLGTRLQWVELCGAAAAGAAAFALCGVFVLGRMRLTVDVRLDSTRIAAGERTFARISVEYRAHRLALADTLELAVRLPGERSPAVTFPARRVTPGPPGGPPGANASEAVLEVGSPRRGVIVLGPTSTVRSDPLGLLRRTVTWPQVTEVLVHPRLVPLPPLGAGLRHDLDGRTADQVSASDFEFHTLRDYVPGDDRRHIDWRSSARASSMTPDRDRFLVRQFLQTRRTHLLVVVDGDAAAYPDEEDFETAVTAGASVAVQALRDGLDVTLVAAGRVARDATWAGVLEASARASFGGGGTLAQATGRAVRVSPQSTSALLVTGSQPVFGQRRAARRQLRPEVSTRVLRVDPGAPAAVAPGESWTELILPALTDLPFLVTAGAAR